MKKELKVGDRVITVNSRRVGTITSMTTNKKSVIVTFSSGTSTLLYCSSLIKLKPRKAKIWYGVISPHNEVVSIKKTLAEAEHTLARWEWHGNIYTIILLKEFKPKKQDK